MRISSEIAKRIGKCGGGALIVDYGREGALGTETLRAIKKHDIVSPLQEPGKVDLSADVDFDALRRAAFGKSIQGGNHKLRF